MKGQATVPVKGVDKPLFCKLDPRKHRLAFSNKESSLIASITVDLVSHKRFFCPVVRLPALIPSFARAQTALCRPMGRCRFPSCRAKRRR
jgi:hypothetical protein